MATTTVRLDPGDEERLDALAARHGGRSQALRRGLKLLDAADRQRQGLAALVADWEAEDGRPVTQAERDDAAARYGL